MAVSEERYEVEDEFDMVDDLDGQDDEQQSSLPQPESPSVWQTIRRFFFKSSSERESENRLRMYVLNNAIETYPDAAVNYLLRGELYLEIGRHDAAKDDFEKALELATDQYDNERWGLASQTVKDRAMRGLHQIKQ